MQLCLYIAPFDGAAVAPVTRSHKQREMDVMLRVNRRTQMQENGNAETEFARRSHFGSRGGLSREISLLVATVLRSRCAKMSATWKMCPGASGPLSRSARCRRGAPALRLSNLHRASPNTPTPRSRTGTDLRAAYAFAYP